MITIEKFEIIFFDLDLEVFTNNKLFENKFGARMTKMMISGKG